MSEERKSYVERLTAGECPQWVCEQLQYDLDVRDELIERLRQDLRELRQDLQRLYDKI